MARPSILRNEPKWLTDLEIEPLLLEQVREEAQKIYTKDVVSFAIPSPPEKSARLRRRKLGNPWPVPLWLAYTLFCLLVFEVRQILLN